MPTTAATTTRRALWGLALVNLALGLGACTGEGGSPTGPGAGDGDAPRDILIEGNISTAVGTTTQLTATARYPDGREIDVTGDAVWSASDPASASVDGGLVSGHATSSNDITVTYAGVSETGPFYVARSPFRGMHNEITQESAIAGAGSTAQFHAFAEFVVRGTIEITNSARWWSYDESVATVTDDGVVTGVSTGVTGIFCVYRGATFGVDVEVGDPPQMYDVQVNPQIFYTNGASTCDSATNFDGRDGEFSIQINVITPDGTRHLVLETENYPGDEHVIEADSGDEVSLSASHPSLTGPGVLWVTLSEIQSMEIELRVTEWDLSFTDFGDPVRDADMDDEVVVRTHYGSGGFGHGEHTVRIVGATGDCEIGMDYIMNVQ